MSVIRKLLIRNCYRKIGKYSFIVSRNQSQISFEKNILKSDFPNPEIPRISVVEYVFEKFDNWPDQIATECAVTGRKYAYGELKSKVTNLSKTLRKNLRLQKGDVISILLPNCPEFALVTLGSLKAGLVVSTMNPTYTPDEIGRQINDSSTKAIITLNEFYPLAKKSVEMARKTIPILAIKTQPDQNLANGAINFWEFLEDTDYPENELPKPEDLAFLPYSSGTTGMPKGVQLTHKNMVSNLSQTDFPELCFLHNPTATHQDCHPAVLPYFHIYGLSVTCLHPLERGCRSVCLPKFTPELYVNTIRKYKPDCLYLAPPIIHFLTGHPSVAAKDLASVRTVLCGAAPLGALDEEKFLQKAQKQIGIYQGYGLTETSPVVSMTRAAVVEIPSSRGSIGQPIPSTFIKIVDITDPNDTPLGPNQIGEMLVKGPQVMKGYLNKPEETAKILTKDGWLRTGDMMYYNDDNLLFITDRLKELIKVKGFQVPPAELEEIIRDFPDVEDAGVVGIPHPNDGEVPRAYVVVKGGKKLDVEKLNKFVSSKVAPYKQLKGGIEIIENIPKNASGKILRRELKLRFEGQK